MNNVGIFLSHNDISISTRDSSWQISRKKGIIAGISASVSGLGAWAKLKGTGAFDTRVLEESSRYQNFIQKHQINLGLNSFFSWINTGDNAQVYREEIIEIFDEISISQSFKGTVNIDLSASGQYSNVEVTAMAYVSVLDVTSATGSNFNIISSSSPSQDTGACNPQNGQSLPNKDNNSTIIL